MKENRRMWTCNRLDLPTLRSQPVMPKNLPVTAWKGLPSLPSLPHDACGCPNATLGVAKLRKLAGNQLTNHLVTPSRSNSPLHTLLFATVTWEGIQPNCGNFRRWPHGQKGLFLANLLWCMPTAAAGSKWAGRPSVYIYMSLSLSLSIYIYWERAPIDLGWDREPVRPTTVEFQSTKDVQHKVEGYTGRKGREGRICKLT